MSEINDKLYRFELDKGRSYYAIDLNKYPQDHRTHIKDDLNAAKKVLNSLDCINVPKAIMDVDQNNELFIMEDKGVGKTDEIESFYESAGFHILTSNCDIKGNIVEGSEGYAPIDFEAFLRSPMDEEVTYYKNGRKMKTNVELYRQSLANTEIESQRHDIEFDIERLAKATENVAKILKDLDKDLRDIGYSRRADNLETNIKLVLENDLILE